MKPLIKADHSLEMTCLFIIGAGGHGKVAAEIAEACGFADIRFLDQCWPDRTANGRWPILGVPSAQEGPVFCAIGLNEVRARIFSELNLMESPRLVHPSAVISSSAELGAGTIAVAGSVVNIDARIGRGVILNTGSSVDHDCILGDFVHVSPGARLAGGVIVGDRTWIGIGAVVREGIKLGSNVVVAAGAVVLEDVPDGHRVAGTPARQMP